MNPNITLKIYLTLRIAVAMCFIGHGAFGIITKPVWCNYFAIVGIDTVHAYQLMPVLGIVDIVLGLSMLVYPTRLVAGWLVVWGLVTASLRPLSGEPIAEFIERAGNYGAPLAFLLLTGITSRPKVWIQLIKPVTTLSERRSQQLYTCLRVAGFMLFIGHAWLNLLMKKSLLAQYSLIGFEEPARIAYIIGLTEIAFALIILLKPVRELLVIMFAWKILSETLYPSYPLFEWIERGGSYAVLLALVFLTPTSFSYRKAILKRTIT